MTKEHLNIKNKLIRLTHYRQTCNLLYTHKNLLHRTSQPYLKHSIEFSPRNYSKQERKFHNAQKECRDLLSTPLSSHNLRHQCTTKSHHRLRRETRQEKRQQPSLHPKCQPHITVHPERPQRAIAHKNSPARKRRGRKNPPACHNGIPHLPARLPDDLFIGNRHRKSAGGGGRASQLSARLVRKIPLRSRSLAAANADAAAHPRNAPYR